MTTLSMPTTTSISPPSCLHIPALKRGLSASILWEANTGYELDWAVTRESDEGLRTWKMLEDSQLDWRTIEDGEYTWLTLEDRAEAPWEALYRGHGELSDLGAGDCAPAHAIHSAVIPADALTVRFRVRSYAGRQFSPYAESELFYLDMSNGPEVGGSVSLDLVAGREYHVQVNLRDLPEFGDGVLALAYPAEKLELLDTALDSGGFHADFEEHTYESGIKEVAREPGVFRFRCTRGIPEDTDLTGLAACFRFTALADGAATVSLG